MWGAGGGRCRPDGHSLAGDAAPLRLWSVRLAYWLSQRGEGADGYGTQATDSIFVILVAALVTCGALRQQKVDHTNVNADWDAPPTRYRADVQVPPGGETAASRFAAQDHEQAQPAGKKQR